MLVVTVEWLITIYIYVCVYVCIQHAVDEELIEMYKHSGMNGVIRTSLEQEGFKVPETPDEWVG